MKVAVLIPAYQAEASIVGVVRGIREAAERSRVCLPVWVVDDGSSDATERMAISAGAITLRHPSNCGKGKALLTGFRALIAEGFTSAVTVDADGQHPTEEVLRLATHPAPAETLVLAVRDLSRDGAPKDSQFSNSVSNRFLSWFTGLSLKDTQCGLRRYPILKTMELHPKSMGYAFEAEVIIRAVRAGIRIEQVPARVWYPDPSQRISHFHKVKDPARVVCRVLGAWLDRGAP